MKKFIFIVVLAAAIILLTGCPDLWNPHPCDGTWELSNEENGKRTSMEIYVFESEIYRFEGTCYDTAEEETVTSVMVYGNGIPLVPLYYNDEVDGYWFEYPEEGVSGLDHFTGHLYPKTGTFSCAFWSIGSPGSGLLEGGGTFTPSE